MSSNRFPQRGAVTSAVKQFPLRDSGCMILGFVLPVYIRKTREDDLSWRSGLKNPWFMKILANISPLSIKMIKYNNRALVLTS